MDQNQPKLYEISIRTTPERLWQALTDPELTQKYYFNTRAESDWKPGSPVVYRTQDGFVVLTGKVVEAEAPRRLVTTFEPTWSNEVANMAPSTVTWEIEPSGEESKLRLTHSGLDSASSDARGILDAWPPTLSSLKSMLDNS
jgi:uncharacterized protein YndB with AHSA1/START domain